MSTGPQTDIKILATGLGAGILVDATLIRCLLVPRARQPPRRLQLVAPGLGRATAARRSITVARRPARVGPRPDHRRARTGTRLTANDLRLPIARAGGRQHAVRGADLVRLLRTKSN
jgi:hypothetical protein